MIPLALLKMAILSQQRKQPEEERMTVLPLDASVWSWVQDRIGAIVNSSSATSVLPPWREREEKLGRLSCSLSSQHVPGRTWVALQLLPHGVHILHNPSSVCVCGRRRRGRGPQYDKIVIFLIYNVMRSRVEYRGWA